MANLCVKLSQNNVKSSNWAGWFQYLFKGDFSVCPELIAEDSSLSLILRIHFDDFLLRFKNTNALLEWYSEIPRRRWQVSWAEISHSAILWSSNFWTEVSIELLGMLSLRI